MEEWSVTESTLTACDGEYLMQFGFCRYKNNTERNTAEDGTVLGANLGIEHLVVPTFFVSRWGLTHTSASSRGKCRLQQTGTRSAHRTLDT
ncbi:hypothetical protein [Halocatena marina]|uniref:hypothetical protein n=1 Tax=Halocatena marina TaxID=2934937 RepID=UPI00200FF7A2|nr:hypothetical protein [Halocatena marina]